MHHHILHNQETERSNERAAEEVNSCKDPIGMLKKMFVDITMHQRIASGQYPALRPVFLKPHGIARGIFTINPQLPDDLKVGLFKHDSFPAWVRFSGDTIPSKPDLKTSLGLGIKLFGVSGEKLLDGEEGASTHDILLQNHDVFFVDDASAMCEFTYAATVSKNTKQYLLEHPNTQQIINDMQKVVTSVLGTPYWSTIPYAFGSGRYVKYKLEPGQGVGVDSQPDDLRIDPNYLRSDLRRRLLKGCASFKFYLQFYVNEDETPIDKATFRWDETVSRPIFAATLTIPKQDIDARGQAAYGENLAFNPWHALHEHKPVGSIADARKVVYQAAAEFRRNINGIPVAEPSKPRQV